MSFKLRTDSGMSFQLRTFGVDTPLAHVRRTQQQHTPHSTYGMIGRPMCNSRENSPKLRTTSRRSQQ
ncbi:hypothetical protein BHE74_00039492 [Ensete ventricosum]|nr:hypothetical protein GW17_00029181 [Ensete ventricosum]RWW53975.1 hypothetical protein BHE74_00039492 [Ensete ventricosum]